MRGAMIGLAASWFLTGCAVMGPIETDVPKAAHKSQVLALPSPIYALPFPMLTIRSDPKPPGPPSTDLLDDGYADFLGIIHIHTRYSDGAGTFRDVIRVANQLHLDYVVVTDHNTLQPLRDGWQGWHGMTLVLVGTELSTRAGHYLAMNITQEVDRDQPTQAIIDEVARQGGLGFIAHPFFKKRRWTDWSVTGFTGIEGYNTVHDAFDENKVRIALWGIGVPPDPLFLSMIDRPYDPLSTWDEMLRRHDRVVGIGSADAHEFHVPLVGIKIAPYEIMFKLVRTHVLLPEGEDLSPETFYDALGRGHAFFSIDLLADGFGFAFFADDGKQVVGIQGDEVPLAPGLRLTAVLPAAAQLTLFLDGQAIASTTETVWHIPVTKSGTYRLEASRYNRPWIFSNPIYVRPRDTDAPATPQ